MTTTTYSSQFGTLTTAKRMSDDLGLQMAERKATEYATWHARGTEARDFWMKVAAIVSEVRSEVA